MRIADKGVGMGVGVVESEPDPDPDPDEEVEVAFDCNCFNNDIAGPGRGAGTRAPSAAAGRSVWGEEGFESRR